MIKNIVKLENVILYNANHDEDYFSRQGVLMIENDDNTKQILDLESMTDISNSDYIELKVIKRKTKMTYLFKNIFYDEERLRELAGK